MEPERVERVLRALRVEGVREEPVRGCVPVRPVAGPAALAVDAALPVAVLAVAPAGAIPHASQ